jgi:hypothetical protein
MADKFNFGRAHCFYNLKEKKEGKKGEGSVGGMA